MSTKEEFEKAVKMLASPAPFDDIFALVAAIRAHVAELEKDLERERHEAKEHHLRCQVAERERDELKASLDEWQMCARTEASLADKDRADLNRRIDRLTRSKPLHYDLTDDGIKVCTGEHDRDQPCEWSHYVDIEKHEALKRLYHQAAEAVQRKYHGHEPLEDVLRKAAECDELKKWIESSPKVWAYAKSFEDLRTGRRPGCYISNKPLPHDPQTICSMVGPTIELRAVPVAEVQEKAYVKVSAANQDPVTGALVQEKEAGEDE